MIFLQKGILFIQQQRIYLHWRMKRRFKFLFPPYPWRIFTICLQKQKSPDEAKQILRKFKVLITISPLNEKIIDLALNSEFTDFEDAIQYFSALQNNVEVFMTEI